MENKISGQKALGQWRYKSASLGNKMSSHRAARLMGLENNIPGQRAAGAMENTKQGRRVLQLWEILKYGNNGSKGC